MKPNGFAAMLVLTLTAASVACGGFASPSAPDPAPVPTAPSGDSVDMGNPSDEAHHALKGWGAVSTETAVPPEPGADRTARYQLARLSNSLDLVVSAPAAAYTLVFRTQDGACDDSFDLYVNGGGPLYRYRHRDSSDLFPTHRVPIEASMVPTTTLRITFVNVATDNCGFAAVYYVRAE